MDREAISPGATRSTDQGALVRAVQSVSGSEPPRCADIYICGSERFTRTRTIISGRPARTGGRIRRAWTSTVLAEHLPYWLRQRAPVAEQKGGLGNDAEYPLCLGYGVFAVWELLEQASPSLVLGGSDSIGVAVGFDSGDFVLLGELTINGLTPFAPDAKLPEIPIEPVLQPAGSFGRQEGLCSMLETLHSSESMHELPSLNCCRSPAGPMSLGFPQAAVSMLADVAPDDSRVRATALQAFTDGNPFVRREASRP